jgi:hypothetical protein
MVSRLVLDVPDDSDPYTLPEVIGGPQVPTRGWYETFDTVAEMVESQNSWQFAECSNYEPDDGWWSLWTRTAETGLDPSTDPTVLALDGGGFVRRIQPSA